MEEIVVMFCGPHYGGMVDWGRIDRSIALALRLGCPLLICGDARGGWELVVFGCRAEEAGVEMVWVRHNNKANTLGDAISAAAVISAYAEEVRRIHLVTDWYHMPRSFVQLRKKKNRRGVNAWIVPAPVLDRWMEGVRRLRGELMGALHAFIDIPQMPKVKGLPKRKSVLAVLSRSRRIAQRLRT